MVRDTDYCVNDRQIAIGDCYTPYTKGNPYLRLTSRREPAARGEQDLVWTTGGTWEAAGGWVNDHREDVLYFATYEAAEEEARRLAGGAPPMTIEELEYLEVEGW